MNWDTTDMTEKLQELQYRSSLIRDPNERYLIDTDIYHLKNMLNFVAGEKLYEYSKDEIAYRILDQNNYNQMVEFLRSYLPDLAHSLYKIKGVHHVPSRFVIPKKITDEEFDRIITNFLRSFDTDLLSLYKKMKSENRFQRGARTLGSRTCLGSCFVIFSYGESYCYSKNYYRIRNIANTLHELAHAYHYEGENNASVHQRKLYSVLGEAYPKFVELCFYDYLQNTTYYKEAINELGATLDSLLIYLEYGLGDFYNVPYPEYEEGNILKYNGFGQVSNIIELILSHIVAVHWLNIYRNNPEEGKKVVQEFNDSYGISTVEEVLSSINMDELSDNNVGVILNYCKTYKKNR